MNVRKALAKKGKAIRLLVFDVDGVLTDGRIFVSESGEQTKAFSFIDIMGLSIAMKAGYTVAVISGEKTPINDFLMRKGLVHEVLQGVKDKRQAIEDLRSKYMLRPESVCFVGDDINDLPALEVAGLAITVPNATLPVRKRVRLVTKSAGGSGAVREIIDSLLDAVE